eukprot:3100014-Prymnesium_polylepis.2
MLHQIGLVRMGRKIALGTIGGPPRRKDEARELDGGRDEAEAPADLPGEALALVHFFLEILAAEWVGCGV